MLWQKVILIIISNENFDELKIFDFSQLHSFLAIMVPVRMHSEFYEIHSLWNYTVNWNVRLTKTVHDR